MSKKEFNLKLSLNRVAVVVQKLRAYSIPGFVIFIALLYGLVLLRINTLSNATPSATVIDSNVQSAPAPHIDPAVVQQLQSLQDNSVSVKTLFDQARNNPF